MSEDLDVDLGVDLGKGFHHGTSGQAANEVVGGAAEADMSGRNRCAKAVQKSRVDHILPSDQGGRHGGGLVA